MQKVNVFAQFTNGGTYYKTEHCQRTTTIEEIVQKCELMDPSARVYLNGTLIPPENYGKNFADYKAGNPAFISVKYFVPVGKSASSAKQ